MDDLAFDRLSRTVAHLITRRGLGRMLGVFPLAGTLVVVGDEASEAGRRRRRHRPRRRRHKRKKHTPQCIPASAAQTCAERCATVTNNCGTAVNCGPCACGACPTCQICSATTGRCQGNPSFVGLDCGFPGQICQVGGTCACSGGSCVSGQRCTGIVCVCDATSCPTGCCDGMRTCHRNVDGACGMNGGTCAPCGIGTTCCQGTCIPTCTGGKFPNPTTCQCECPSGQTDCSGVCVDLQTDAQHCGTCTTACTAPKIICQGGSCQCPSTTCTDGKIFNPTTCQCDCPAGRVKLNNGKCALTCPTDVCPNGCGCAQALNGPGKVCYNANQCNCEPVDCAGCDGVCANVNLGCSSNIVCCAPC